MTDTPEQNARRNIDADLETAGWCVQSRDELDFTPKRGPTDFGSMICAPTCTSRLSRNQFSAKILTSSSISINLDRYTNAKLLGAKTIPRAVGVLMTMTIY